MKFASLRLIARDINGLTAFYEMLTGLKADWLAPVFAEIVTPSATTRDRQRGDRRTFPGGYGRARRQPHRHHRAAGDRSGRRVRAAKGVCGNCASPKLLPWGNQTFQLRDPEGSLVSLYMPVTEAAKARFGNR